MNKATITIEINYDLLLTRLGCHFCFAREIYPTKPKKIEEKTTFKEFQTVEMKCVKCKKVFNYRVIENLYNEQFNPLKEIEKT